MGEFIPEFSFVTYSHTRTIHLKIFVISLISFFFFQFYRKVDCTIMLHFTREEARKNFTQFVTYNPIVTGPVIHYSSNESSYNPPRHLPQILISALTFLKSPYGGQASLLIHFFLFDFRLSSLISSSAAA